MLQAQWVGNSDSFKDVLNNPEFTLKLRALLEFICGDIHNSSWNDALNAMCMGPIGNDYGKSLRGCAVLISLIDCYRSGHESCYLHDPCSDLEGIRLSNRYGWGRWRVRAVVGVLVIRSFLLKMWNVKYLNIVRGLRLDVGHGSPLIAKQHFNIIAIDVRRLALLGIARGL